MKTRENDKNKRGKQAKSATPVTTTENVIALPDGTAEQAAKVIAETDIEAGPTSEVQDTEAATLYKEATVPKETNDSLEAIENTPPVGEAVDAEFEEVVPSTTNAEMSDVELAANQLKTEIQEANERNAEDTRDEVGITRPGIDRAFAEREGVEVSFVDFSFRLLSEGSQKKLEQFQAFAKQLWLKAVALGNEAVAAYDKAALAMHAKLSEKMAPFNAWAVKKLGEWDQLITEWQIERRANAPLTKRDFEAAMEKLDAKMNQVVQAEQAFRLAVKALKKDTKATKKLTRATNRAAESQEPDASVSPAQFTRFIEAVTEGKKIDAVAACREITGWSLADARMAVENMVAP